MRSREFLNLIIHDCKFLDGFLKISNIDQLITALKFFFYYFIYFWSKKLDVE